MVAVERRVGAGAVAQRYARDVVAAGSGDHPALRHSELVGEIGAEIGVLSRHAHARREATEAERAAIGRERRLLAVLAEIRAGAIERRAERQPVGRVAQPAVHADLHGSPRHRLVERAAVVESLRVARADRQPRIEILVQVARQVALAQGAQVGAAGDQNIVGEVAAGAQGEKGKRIIRPVRPGVGLAWVAEHGERQRLCALQRVIGERERNVDVAARVLPAAFHERLADAARRVVAPAGFVVRVPREEPVGALAMTAVLELRRAAAERTAGNPRGGSGKREAGLGLDRKNAAERVQAEHRIGARQQVRGGDRVARDQVPVHRVAERLVDAHAVDKHGQPLRQAEQRRSGEAAVHQVLLERIALRTVDAGAREAALEMLDHVARVALAQLRRAHALHRRGDVAQRRAEAGHRCRADDLDRGAFKQGGWIVRRLGRRGQRAERSQRGDERAATRAHRITTPQGSSPTRMSRSLT